MRSTNRMAGHSKWANIKHKKAATDAKRGKTFTRLTKEITVAAKTGGGDQEANPRLRTLVDKAKEVNMPSENINRAIKRGTGELPGVTYEEKRYEGYGPEGIAILVDVLTDNKNRTVAELRKLFTRFGGSLAEGGAVSWMFDRLGCIRVKGTASEEQLLELLLDYDINDIKIYDDVTMVLCDPKEVEAVKKVLIDNGLTIESSVVEWLPQNPTSLDPAQSTKVYEFLELLDDHDDIKNVYANVA